MCYLDRELFLSSGNSFRRCKKSFDSEKEHRDASTTLSGKKVPKELHELNDVYITNQKKN